MAFIIYKQKFKGKRGQTLPRDKALAIIEALKHKDTVTDPQKRAYLDNVLQVSVPEERERTVLVKPELPEPEIGHNIPSGKDFAAGDV